MNEEKKKEEVWYNTSFNAGTNRNFPFYSKFYVSNSALERKRDLKFVLFFEGKYIWKPAFIGRIWCGNDSFKARNYLLSSPIITNFGMQFHLPVNHNIISKFIAVSIVD